MPGYRAHLVGGAAVYGFAVYALQSLHPTPLTMIEWLGLSLLGSLFPDIDIKSKGQKLFYSFLLAIFFILLITNRSKAIIALSFVGLVPILVNHRGLFHKTWFIMIFPLAVALVCGTYTHVSCRALLLDALFFTLGALSHLWLDLGVRRMFRT